MSTQENIVAATKFIGEDSDSSMGGSGSKMIENPANEFDLKKNDNGASASVVSVQAETLEWSSNRDKCENGVSSVSEKVETLERFSNGDKCENGVPLVREKVETLERSSNGDNCAYGVSSVVNENVETLEEFNEGKVENGVENGVLVDGSDDQTPGGQEHQFRVGDLVWGKIRDHPWWPAQVYDASDASDFAVKHSFSQEDRLLVAFFGDRSCAWCLPSQLVPFIDNFAEKSTGRNSKIFHNAVQMALNEIGRILELEIVCKCIPEERRVGLSRPVVDNVGVKAGVLVPNTNLPQLSVTEYEPSDVLLKISYYAENVSYSSGLEVTVLRSWLSAYYRYKGGCSLPLFREPIVIEGLENKPVVVGDDFSVPTEVPFTGPPNDDNSPLKSLARSDSKVHQKRKRKSVAKLMEQSVKEGSDLGMTLSSLKRKKTEDQSGGGESRRKGKKRKVENRESHEKTNGNVSEAVNEEGPLSEKQKKLEVSLAEANFSDGKAELDIVTSPRERKLSKYLSAPFTSLPWQMLILRSKTESDKIAKKARIDKASSEEQQNLPDSKMEKIDGLINAISHQTVFPLYDVAMPADEFLSEIAFAAVNPLSLRNNGSFDLVRGFASARRSSTYLHGEHYSTFQKCKKGKKIPSQVGSSDDESVSDAKLVINKLEIMTAILENYHSKFSEEEKLKLKEAMKHLMETVDNVSEMVEAISEKVRINAENGSSSGN